MARNVALCSCILPLVRLRLRSRDYDLFNRTAIFPALHALMASAAGSLESGNKHPDSAPLDATFTHYVPASVGTHFTISCPDDETKDSLMRLVATTNPRNTSVISTAPFTIEATEPLHKLMFLINHDEDEEMVCNTLHLHVLRSIA